MKLEQFSRELNIRDLGGYPTRDGRHVIGGLFFRSSGPYLFSEEELNSLKKLNIRYIIDFRTAKEWDRNPDPEIEGAHYIRHSGVESTGGKEVDFSPAGMMQMGEDGERQLEKLVYYYRMISFDNEALRLFFAAVKNGHVPLLFHCHSGKDRTGAAAILLLALLNVDEETIIQDYLLSNEYYRETLEREFAASPIDLEAHPETRELIQMMHGVSERIGRTVYRGIIERYGTVEEYFRQEYGFSDQDIKEIRERYTR